MAVAIRAAAAATGWSPRMLRYLEQVGLVRPQRSPGGIRRYSPAELDRLGRLRHLLASFDVALGDLAFLQRLRTEPQLRAAVDEWFAAEPRPPAADPDASDPTGWLRFEQDKHQRLLAGVASPAAAGRAPTPPSDPTRHAPPTGPAQTEPTTTERQSA